MSPPPPAPSVSISSRCASLLVASHPIRHSHTLRTSTYPSTLQDAWSPVLTLKSTLISLQSLLCSPEPNDPQDAEVAKHYTTSKRSFDETAAYWTHIYAGGPPPKGKAAAGDDIAMAGLDPVHVKKFEGMGFTRGAVVSRLCLSAMSGRDGGGGKG